MTSSVPLDAPEGAARLVDLLVRGGRTIGVAESLTGGSVTDALVSVPGASGCLRGGIVTYATDLKSDLLGVAADLLATHGAVHPQVALAMAHGARRVLRADYGIATTGVAGPTEQDGRPPGTFHVAISGPLGDEVVSAVPTASGAGSRAQVRSAARDAVLDLALRRVGADLWASGERGPSA